MNYYVYVLWSEKLKKRYVGSTKDVIERLRQHNNGTSKFTSGGIPWKLIHHEEYETLQESRQREKYLKSGFGRKWLNENFSDLKNKFRRGARVVESGSLENC
ncbi:MAG: GIY-YIG nuclease family protein [Ignavibacteriales bacterium]|nr:GIY-YIG nuclease family protein [Ignavibacteriales bacterium]